MDLRSITRQGGRCDGARPAGAAGQLQLACRVQRQSIAYLPAGARGQRGSPHAGRTRTDGLISKQISAPVDGGGAAAAGPNTLSILV